jgi:hypothetical protein
MIRIFRLRHRRGLPTFAFVNGRQANPNGTETMTFLAIAFLIFAATPFVLALVGEVRCAVDEWQFRNRPVKAPAPRLIRNW